MHLVVFGLSITSSWGNGHATVYRSLLPAMARRGHRVTFFEADRHYYARRRDQIGFAGVELVIYPDWSGIRRPAMALAAGADAVMTTSFCPDGAAIQAELLALAKPRKIFYDMDTPVTLAGLAGGSEETRRSIQAEQLPELDLYLSFTGGPLLEELRRRWGVRRTAALYLCADPAQYAPVAVDQKYRARLSFLGTWAADREEAMERLFLEPARRLRRERFTLAGALYPEPAVWPENVVRWEHLAPGEHAAFHCSSGFALNLTRRAMKTWGYSPPGRLFETALCGVPLISDGWPGLEEFLEPGREVVVAETSDEVVGVLTGMSATAARKMAERARNRVVAEQSGERRAEQLEGLIEGS